MELALMEYDVVRASCLVVPMEAVGMQSCMPCGWRHVEWRERERLTSETVLKSRGDYAMRRACREDVGCRA